MDNFDPNNVLLAIATNIHVLLMTAFVLQAHISDYYQCWKQLCCTISLWKLLFFRIHRWIESSKEQHLFETEIFCYIMNVFTVTFDQFNALWLNKCIFLFQNVSFHDSDSVICWYEALLCVILCLKTLCPSRVWTCCRSIPSSSRGPWRAPQHSA